MSRSLILWAREHYLPPIRVPSGLLKAVLALNSYHRKLTLSFKAVLRLTVQAAVSVRSRLPLTLKTWVPSSQAADTQPPWGTLPPLL